MSQKNAPVKKNFTGAPPVHRWCGEIVKYLTLITVAISTSFEFRSGQFCIPHSEADLPEILEGSQLQRSSKRKWESAWESVSFQSSQIWNANEPFWGIVNPEEFAVGMQGYRGNAFSLNVIAIMTKDFAIYLYLNWYKKCRTSRISLSSHERVTVQKIARLSRQVVGHLFCAPSLGCCFWASHTPLLVAIFDPMLFRSD